MPLKREKYEQQNQTAIRRATNMLEAERTNKILCRKLINLHTFNTVYDLLTSIQYKVFVHILRQ